MKHFHINADSVLRNAEISMKKDKKYDKYLQRNTEFSLMNVEFSLQNRKEKINLDSNGLQKDVKFVSQNNLKSSSNDLNIISLFCMLLTPIIIIITFVKQ